MDEEQEDESAEEGRSASEEEGETLAGLNLLPGLQLGGRGRGRGGRSRGDRSRGSRSRGGRSRGGCRSRGGSRTRASRGRRGRMGSSRGGGIMQEEDDPPALSELRHHTALLADPETDQDGQVASHFSSSSSSCFCSGPNMLIYKARESSL